MLLATNPGGMTAGGARGELESLGSVKPKRSFHDFFVDVVLVVLGREVVDTDVTSSEAGVGAADSPSSGNLIDLESGDSVEGMVDGTVGGLLANEGPEKGGEGGGPLGTGGNPVISLPPPRLLLFALLIPPPTPPSISLILFAIPTSATSAGIGGSGGGTEGGGGILAKARSAALEPPLLPDKAERDVASEPVVDTDSREGEDFKVGRGDINGDPAGVSVDWVLDLLEI